MVKTQTKGKNAMNVQKQIGKFHATLLENLPEMTPDVMQGWIENPKALQKNLQGLAPSSPERPSFRLADKTERDMTGWESVKPVPVEEGEFEVMESQKILRWKAQIPTKEAVAQGKKNGANVSLRHLEALLREQHKIPVEMQKSYIVSTEVWAHQNGDGDHIWYICWNGQCWELFGHYLALITDPKFQFGVAKRK